MKIRLILNCFLLFTIGVFSQIENPEYTAQKDSTLKFLGVNPQLNVPDQVYELDLRFKFWHQQSNFLIGGNKANLWLRTEMALSYPGSLQGFLFLPLPGLKNSEHLSAFSNV